MARLTIPEVLELLEDRSSDERTTILQKNDTKSLRHILYSAFHPDVEFALPSERPNDLKIDETPVGISDNSLYQQSRKLKIFMKNTGYDHLSGSKREVLFMQILESIHHTEAELLLQICVDRDIKSSLTYQEVSEAFPGLLPAVEIESIQEQVVLYQDIASKLPPSDVEQPVHQDMDEFYKKNQPKKKSKSKKSSKKKGK